MWTFVCVCLPERQKNEPYLQIRFYGHLTVTVNGAALVKPTRITRKKRKENPNFNAQEKERTVDRSRPGRIIMVRVIKSVVRQM